MLSTATWSCLQNIFVCHSWFGRISKVASLSCAYRNEVFLNDFYCLKKRNARFSLIISFNLLFVMIQNKHLSQNWTAIQSSTSWVKKCHKVKNFKFKGALKNGGNYFFWRGCRNILFLKISKLFSQFLSVTGVSFSQTIGV